MSLQTIEKLCFGVDRLGDIPEATKKDLAVLITEYETYFDRLWAFSYDKRYNAYKLFLYLVLEDFLAPTDKEIEEAMEVVWRV